MSQGSIPLFWRLKKSKYNLVGTKCKTCQGLFFPPKTLCPTCRRKGELSEFQFSGSGEILSYTTVNAPPQGFEEYAPYFVGILRLDEGVNISAQIVGDTSKIDVGKRVKSVFRKMSEDGQGGIINYGIKFEIVD